MAHLYIIRKTLRIKDQNIHLKEKVNEKKIKGTNHIIYYGKLTYTLSACESCGLSISHLQILLNLVRKNQ